MIDILYNGILVVIVLFWALSNRAARFGRLMAVFKRWWPAIALSLWAVFIAFAVWYLLSFDHFEEIHDIDDAVETAVLSADNGINPYEEYVVPRFKGKYVAGVDWTLGPYNYMPLDLLTYMGAEALLGSLDTPIWFVVTNMVFAGLAMVMLRDITGAPWLVFIPMAGTVMLFYSMDNASLTLLLMTGSILALRRVKWFPEAVSLFIMGLALLTKVYAAIPFLVMMLYFAQSSIAARDWHRMSATVLAVGASVAVALLVIMPFGMSNVLDAAVFFHTSEDLRVGTSAGGTLLSEIALESPYFAVIGASLVVAAVLVGLWAKSMNDRVILATVAFLLIAVKSSLAPLTVAGLFLALRMKELADERAVSLPSQIPSDAQGDADVANAVPIDR